MTNGGQVGIGHKGTKARLTNRGKGGFGEPIVEEKPKPEIGCTLVIISDSKRCEELRRRRIPNIGHIISVKDENFEVLIPDRYPWVDQYRKDELKFPCDVKKQE